MSLPSSFSASPRPASKRLEIRVFVENAEQRHALTQQPIRIGRELDNEIVLPDSSVSRHHATITALSAEPERSAWEIVDHASTNGLYVNDVLTSRAVLAPGDRVRIGSFLLRVEMAPSAVEPSSQPVLAPTTMPLGPIKDVRDSLPQGTLIRPLTEFAAQYGLDSGARAEKRQALEEAYENRIFGHLTRLGSLLLAADSVDEVLERVMTIAFEALPVDRGFILLLDAAGEPVCELARSGTKVLTRPKTQVPVSRTILDLVMRERVALSTSDAQSDDRLDSGDSIRMHQIRSAMCAPLWSVDRIVGVIQVDTPYWASAFTGRDLDFLTALANYGAMAVERLRFAERAEIEARLRARLARYHAPEVIEEVLRQESGPGDLEHSRSAEVTIFFADLVGFTAFAETAPPTAVTKLLSGLFERAVEAVFAAGGTLDKFIGDCVMAFFGAPKHQSDHAERAVAAAIDLQRRIAEWNLERVGAGLSPVAVRVGLNSGVVVVGEVGTARRVEYTVLGNAVNVAARLESQAAGPGDVVLGGETARSLPADIPLEPLGELALRGLSRPVEVFRVRRTW